MSFYSVIERGEVAELIGYSASFGGGLSITDFAGYQVV